MTDVLIAQGIVPGVKVDKGLHPLPGSNNELWCGCCLAMGRGGRICRSALCCSFIQRTRRRRAWRSRLLVSFHAAREHMLLTAPPNLSPSHFHASTPLQTRAHTHDRTAGLDGLEERCREYHAAGARFAKWRGVVSVPAGPSELAVRECAWGLARYAAAAQAAGLVPVVEPEVLTDGAHGLRAAVTTAERVWAAVFSALADCGVVLEGTLLKPSMVLPGAECPAGGAEPEAVAEATLAVLRRRVPPAVPGILFLSGGQQETEATANLQAMNERGPHPWRLSFSFARALQASVLRAWKGKPENAAAAQRALLIRAAANSAAQRGLYHPAFEGETAEATDSLYEQQYTY